MCGLLLVVADETLAEHHAKRESNGKCHQPLLEFCEAVVARSPGAQLNTHRNQWLEGLLLGRDNLVGSAGGIVRCRAVRRVTLARRWLGVRCSALRGDVARAKGRTSETASECSAGHHLTVGKSTHNDGASSIAKHGCVRDRQSNSKSRCKKRHLLQCQTDLRVPVHRTLLKGRRRTLPRTRATNSPVSHQSDVCRMQH